MAAHARRSRRVTRAPGSNPALGLSPARSRRTPHLLNLFLGKREKRKYHRASLVGRSFLSLARLPCRTRPPKIRWGANHARYSLAHPRAISPHDPGNSSLRRLLRRNSGTRLKFSFISANPRVSVAIVYRTSKLTVVPANTFCPAAGT